MKQGPLPAGWLQVSCWLKRPLPPPTPRETFGLSSPGIPVDFESRSPRSRRTSGAGGRAGGERRSPPDRSACIPVGRGTGAGRDPRGNLGVWVWKRIERRLVSMVMKKIQKWDLLMSSGIPSRI